MNRSVSSRKARRRFLADFRTESILAAARVVFARYGFAGTTVDRIASEAGVAKGTLYLYYRSKGAIYAAAVIAGLQELAAQSMASLSADVPIREKVRRLIEIRLAYFETRADFFRIYNAEIGRLGEGVAHIRQEHRRLFEEQVSRLTAELEAAVRRRDIRAVNCRQTALAVLDLSHGLTQRRLDATGGGEDIDDLMHVLWRGIQRS